MYRLLGVVARLNESLSHTRINFIPLSGAVLFGLVVLVVYCLRETYGAIVYGNQPRVATVREALLQKDTERNYFTIRGKLISADTFQKIRSEYFSADQDKTPYRVIVDKEGMRALLVEGQGNQGSPTDTQAAEVTGMLVPLGKETHDELAEMGSMVENVPFDMSYMLVQGSTPGNAFAWIGATGLSSILFTLFVVTFLNRYVVFQITPATPQAELMSAAASPSEATPSPMRKIEGIDLRVTGRFRLNEKIAQRFLNVPAAITQSDQGEIALFSNLDASIQLMGFTAEKRKGTWAIVIQPSSINRLETGYLYDGLTPRPAFRVYYADTSTHREANVILCFSSESEREILLSEMTRLAGHPLAST